MKIITSYCKANILTIFCSLYFLFGCTKETIVGDLGSSFTYQPAAIVPGVMIGDVYTTKNFAAFTDIAFFNNYWYITFRAGTKHVGGLSGQIKIMKSSDAVTWKVQQIIANDSLDLRDSKFVVDSANNTLLMNYTGIKNVATGVKVYGFISPYIAAADKWDEPSLIINDSSSSEQFLFWRLTYSKGKIYSASYRVPILGGYTTDNICLFNNRADFKTYAATGKLKLGNSPNEATIRFDANDNMYFLIRREVAPVALGFSTPANYSDVKWIDDPLSTRLSSPNFLFYDNNRLLISGRDQSDLKFKFFSYNLTTRKIEKKFTFPSGDETGYAGMSFNPHNKDELLMSYYVINGNRSSIKLIKMDLKTFLQ